MVRTGSSVVPECAHVIFGRGQVGEVGETGLVIVCVCVY